MGGPEFVRRVHGPGGRMVLPDGTWLKGYQVLFLDAGGMSGATFSKRFPATSPTW